MNEPASSAATADTIAAALRYLRHFLEELDEGAPLIFASGETLFINAAVARAKAWEASP